MTKKNIFLYVVLFVFVGCSSVMLTGRKQVNLVSDSEMTTMAVDNYKQFLSENKLSSNVEYQSMVNRVGANIKKAVDDYMNANEQLNEMANFNWEFNVIEDSQVNAWAMPGGKIVFYEGIMPLCMNDTGVAVVMAHEIAHVLAKHGNERMSQQMLTQYGSVLLGEFIADKPEQSQSMYASVYALGSQYGVLLPFSRKHESEADEIGQIIMAMAGYDPAAAPLFWERMSAASSGDAPLEVMSTHPSDETRVRLLRENTPKAKEYLP